MEADAPSNCGTEQYFTYCVYNIYCCRMSSAIIKYNGHLTPSDPLHQPVLIIGQPRNLSKISFDDVKSKLDPRVGEEVFKAAVASLHPSPTDSCSMYLNLATLAALPTKCSRHNTPSHAHSLTKLVKSLSAGVDEYVVVSSFAFFEEN